MRVGIFFPPASESNLGLARTYTDGTLRRVPGKFRLNITRRYQIHPHPCCKINCLLDGRLTSDLVVRFAMVWGWHFSPILSFVGYVSAPRALQKKKSLASSARVSTSVSTSVSEKKKVFFYAPFAASKYLRGLYIRPAIIGARA